jgi:hypothetical protein
MDGGGRPHGGLLQGKGRPHGGLLQGKGRLRDGLLQGKGRPDGGLLQGVVLGHGSHHVTAADHTDQAAIVHYGVAMEASVYK